MALKGPMIFDTGLSLQNAYLVIYEIRKKYPDDNRVCVIYFDVFRDRQAYSEKKMAITSTQIEVVGKDFDAYFTEKVLDDIGKTELTQAYEYLLTLNDYSKMTKVA
jgi:hypothetical protein